MSLWGVGWLERHCTGVDYPYKELDKDGLKKEEEKSYDQAPAVVTYWWLMLMSLRGVFTAL